jgi:transposase
LARWAEGHEILEAQARAVGVATACVLWAHLGDPRNYSCGAARRLMIAKRGHPQVRRWFCFAALRAVRRPPIRGWYKAQRQREPCARRAFVGVMRRLASRTNTPDATESGLQPLGSRHLPWDQIGANGH